MSRVLWSTQKLPFADISVGPYEHIAERAGGFDELPDYVAHMVDTESARRCKLAFYVDNLSYTTDFDREVAERLISDAVALLHEHPDTQEGLGAPSMTYQVRYHNLASVNREIQATIFRGRYSSIQDASNRGFNNFILRFPRRTNGMLTLDPIEPYMNERANNVQYVTGTMELFGTTYNFFVMHPYVSLKHMDKDDLADSIGTSLVAAFPFLETDVFGKAPDVTGFGTVAYRLSEAIEFHH